MDVRRTALFLVFGFALSCATVQEKETTDVVALPNPPPEKETITKPPPEEEPNIDEVSDQLAAAVREGRVWRMTEGFDSISNDADRTVVANRLLDRVLELADERNRFEFAQVLCPDLSGEQKARAQDLIIERWSKIHAGDRVEALDCLGPKARPLIADWVTQDPSDAVGRIGARGTYQMREVANEALVKHAEKELPHVSEETIRAMSEWSDPAFLPFVKRALLTGKTNPKFPKLVLLAISLQKNSRDFLTRVVRKRKDEVAFFAAEEIASRWRHEGLIDVAKSFSLAKEEYSFKTQGFDQLSETLCQRIAFEYGETREILRAFLASDAWTEQVLGVACAGIYRGTYPTLEPELRALVSSKQRIPGSKRTIGKYAKFVLKRIKKRDASR